LLIQRPVNPVDGHGFGNFIVTKCAAVVDQAVRPHTSQQRRC
jgi:hypothetical protein